VNKIKVVHLQVIKTTGVMKKIFSLWLMLLSMTVAFGQSIESRISHIDELPTASYVREYTLAVGSETGTNALLNDNQYQYDRKEFEWSVKYAALYSGEGQKADESLTYDYMRDALNNYCSYAYNVPVLYCLQSLPRDYSEIESIEDYKRLSHNKLLQNKTVRKFGVKLAKMILKEMVEFYPKDFKKFTIQQIEYALAFMEDIPKHDYKVKWETNEYGYGWLEMYDGEEVDYAASQNLEGIILRRMLLNDIPLSELKSIAEELLSAVKEADNSECPDVRLIIRLNEDLAYCIGCEQPYFISYYPQEQYVDGKGLKAMYTKYEPFNLQVAERIKGWGCDNDIYITAVEHYNEPSYIHDEEGKMVTRNNDLYLYDFHKPTYGFGHCFVENNISKMEIDGFLRIHRKLY